MKNFQIMQSAFYVFQLGLHMDSQCACTMGTKRGMIQSLVGYCTKYILHAYSKRLGSNVIKETCILPYLYSQPRIMLKRENINKRERGTELKVGYSPD